MGGDRLGILDRSAVGEVVRDPGCAEGMSADSQRQARLPSSAADHVEHIRPGHRDT